MISKLRNHSYGHCAGKGSEGLSLELCCITKTVLRFWFLVPHMGRMAGAVTYASHMFTLLGKCREGEGNGLIQSFSSV